MLLDKREHLRRIAFDSAFLGLALILSYLEVLFPFSLFIPLPGFKLGLANVVVLWLAVNRRISDATIVSFSRVTIVSMLFGTPVSFWFSFVGAVFSLVVVIFLRKDSRLSYVGVSVLSASAHNFGQLVAASVLFGLQTMLAYLPIMLLAAVIFGALCGFILNLIAPRIRRGGKL